MMLLWLRITKRLVRKHNIKGMFHSYNPNWKNQTPKDIVDKLKMPIDLNNMNNNGCYQG